MAKAVWFDKEVDLKISNTSKRIIKSASIALSNDMKNMMGDNGAFKPYRSKKDSSQIHWSAEPGNPPNIDTGNLQDSISWATSWGAKGGAKRGRNKGVDSIGGGRLVKSGIVGTNHPGAKALEFGSAHNNLAPRPFMTIAFSMFKLKDFLRKFRL